MINFRPLCRYVNRTIRAEMESDLLNAATSIHGPIFIRAGESHRFHFWQWPLPKLSPFPVILLVVCIPHVLRERNALRRYFDILDTVDRGRASIIVPELFPSERERIFQTRAKRNSFSSILCRVFFFVRDINRSSNRLIRLKFIKCCDE